jgi:adenylylsulfate kinase
VAGGRPGCPPGVLTRVLSAVYEAGITPGYRAPVAPATPARAILLTGTVGSGKTSVAIAIGDLRELDDRPYAVVDLDWLAWVRPAPASIYTVHSLLAENLALIWPRFREAGVERLVLARHLDDRTQLAAVRAGLPGVELFVVRLTAPAALVERRLRARETGAQLEEHLAETARLAARGDAAAVEDAAVENGERPLRQVAEDVLAAAGWR